MGSAMGVIVGPHCALVLSDPDFCVRMPASSISLVECASLSSDFGDDRTRLLLIDTGLLEAMINGTVSHIRGRGFLIVGPGVQFSLRNIGAETAHIRVYNLAADSALHVIARSCDVAPAHGSRTPARIMPWRPRGTA